MHTSRICNIFRDVVIWFPEILRAARVNYRGVLVYPLRLSRFCEIILEIAALKDEISQ